MSREHGIMALSLREHGIMALSLREHGIMALSLRELEDGMASETERHGMASIELHLHLTPYHLLTDIGRKLPMSGSDGVISNHSLRDPEGL